MRPGLNLAADSKMPTFATSGSGAASRVLCRLAPFRAGVAEELFYKVSQIPWELWLNPEIPLDIQAHVEYSRISHEGRVAEIIADSIRKMSAGKGRCLYSEEESRPAIGRGRSETKNPGPS